MIEIFIIFTIITTPYYIKYQVPGMDGGNTIVTIGFYEGINELFLKISK